jgi:hypothetical protein
MTRPMGQAVSGRLLAAIHFIRTKKVIKPTIIAHLATVGGRMEPLTESAECLRRSNEWRGEKDDG